MSDAIVVRDEKKASTWFRTKLGFEIKSNMDHWVTVAPKGSRGPEIHLCKTKPLEKGNTGIAFESDDIDKTYSELAKKGVRFTIKPRDDGWGKYAQFSDLDGNLFWLY
jgi:catechol 2,3-dioxygenase-like lactoylglutathione lyase family enzyme